MAGAGQPKLKVLIRRAAIQKRVRDVAQRITKDFKGERVHVIGVLKGACIFLSDLVREINLDTSIDFIAVSSYGKGKQSSGQVRVLKDLDSSIEGLNVVLVEDISRHRPHAELFDSRPAAAQTEDASHRRTTGQTFTPHQRSESELRGIHDSQ